MTVSKLQKAKGFIVMDYPFFASILLKRKLIETREIPTLGVDGKANIYYNPDFIEKLPVPQIVWGLCHEIGHVIAQHALRRGSRNFKKWNVAGDAWINDMLDEAKVGERIPNCIDMKGSKDKTTEQIYDELPDKPNGGTDGIGTDGIGDDIIEGDNGKPLNPDEVKEMEAEIKVQVAEAAQIAKMRGKLSSKLQDIVSDILYVKTPWYEIVEKYMTTMVAQGQTWRRPNRRFTDNYLPSVDKLPMMGEVVVQVDVSGSISAQETAHYNGHLSRIIEQCRPSKVHVLYTDTQVVRHDEFEQDEEFKIDYFSGGGTDMPAGFAYCDEHGIEPELFVCLTDGYTGFGEAPSYPVVWCISSDIEADHGESVHFELT